MIDEIKGFTLFFGMSCCLTNQTKSVYLFINSFVTVAARVYLIRWSSRIIGKIVAKFRFLETSEFFKVLKTNMLTKILP